MNRNFLGKLLLFFCLSLPLFLMSCVKGNKSGTEAAEKVYTCPMHPSVISDRPGACPVCGMELVPQGVSHELVIDSSLAAILKPVNERVLANLQTITAQTGTRILSVPVQGVVSFDVRRQATIASRVAGRIEKMYVKYNYQPVQKGQLLFEIYSPDLAAAQRDLLFVARRDDDPSLLQKAKQRLLLLGMSQAQISQVLRSGQPLYRVPVYSNASGYIVAQNAAGDMGASPEAVSEAMRNTPLLIREGQYTGSGETLLTIYQSDNLNADFYLPVWLTAAVQKGQKVLFSALGSTEMMSKTISLIEPAQRADHPFAIGRVYLGNSDLQPGQLLKGYIAIVRSGAQWLPEKAVLSLGETSVVFREEGPHRFVAHRVVTGIAADGLVEIKSDITGWQVAENASFLIDSESFIKTANKQ